MTIVVLPRCVTVVTVGSALELVLEHALVGKQVSIGMFVHCVLGHTLLFLVSRACLTLP